MSTERRVARTSRARRFLGLVLLVAVVLVAMPPAAEAQGGPSRTAFVVASAEGRRPSDAVVEARLGEAVTLYAVVREGRGRRTRYYTDAPQLRVGRRRVPARRIQPLSALGPAQVRWYQVEPRQHHVATPAPNDGNPAYSNCVLFGPRHGRWLGYDVLEYHETELTAARDAGQVTVRRASPTARRLAAREGLGTMRFKVAVGVGGAVHASPGAEAVGRSGIGREVFRVSFRRSDDLVGYLTSYFNVPNVFGSAGRTTVHQTELFQGADCADVIIGAARRAGARLEYTSVSGLFRYARPVTERILLDASGLVYADGDRVGQPVELVFGEDVRVGDVMLIDYVGFLASPRSWDHVAVVSGDRGRRGRFDPADPVLHMGYLWGLTEVPAGAEAPAYVQFLRWKPRVQRAFSRHQRSL